MKLLVHNKQLDKQSSYRSSLRHSFLEILIFHVVNQFNVECSFRVFDLLYLSIFSLLITCMIFDVFLKRYIRCYALKIVCIHVIKEIIKLIVSLYCHLQRCFVACLKLSFNAFNIRQRVCRTLTASMYVDLRVVVSTSTSESNVTLQTRIFFISEYLKTTVYNFQHFISFFFKFLNCFLAFCATCLLRKTPS